jgi:hypothetical protein
VGGTYSVGSVIGSDGRGLAFSNRPSRCPPNLTWRRKHTLFPRRCVLWCSLEYRTMDKFQKPGLSCNIFWTLQNLFA